MIYRPYICPLEHAHLSRQERAVDIWGIFLEGGVDSESLTYGCLKGEYILGGRGGFRECPTVAYIFWEGGVDYGSVAYVVKERGIFRRERVDGLENIESGCSHFFSDLDHFCSCLDNF